MNRLEGLDPEIREDVEHLFSSVRGEDKNRLSRICDELIRKQATVSAADALATRVENLTGLRLVFAKTLLPAVRMFRCLQLGAQFDGSRRSHEQCNGSRVHVLDAEVGRPVSK